MKEKNGKALNGVKISGEFVEGQRQELLQKKSFNIIKKGTVCGFHKVEIKNLGVKAGNDEILRNVNIDIYCGELTVIIGKNGAGKSTLIKSITGENTHTGSIKFKDLKNNMIENLRVGYVPQKLFIEKSAPVSVYDMMAALIGSAPVFLFKSKKLYGYIQNRLGIFDAEGLIDKKLGDLSGGELQRVLLATACTPVPNLLILDEPVSGIDRNGIEKFYKTLNELKKGYDLSIILVSHDLELASKYADKMVLIDKTVLKAGKPSDVVQSKEFKEVFSQNALL